MKHSRNRKSSPAEQKIMKLPGDRGSVLGLLTALGSRGDFGRPWTEPRAPLPTPAPSLPAGGTAAGSSCGLGRTRTAPANPGPHRRHSKRRDDRHRRTRTVPASPRRARAGARLTPDPPRGNGEATARRSSSLRGRAAARRGRGAAGKALPRAG